MDIKDKEQLRKEIKRLVNGGEDWEFFTINNTRVELVKNNHSELELYKGSELIETYEYGITYDFIAHDICSIISKFNEPQSFSEKDDDFYNKLSNWDKIKAYLECAICREGDVKQLEEVYGIMLRLEKESEY